MQIWPGSCPSFLGPVDHPPFLFLGQDILVHCPQARITLGCVLVLGLSGKGLVGDTSENV